MTTQMMMNPNMLLLVQLLLVFVIAVSSTTPASTHFRHLKEATQCDGTPEEHSGEVLLTLEGDPDSLDANDIVLLEESYKESLEQVEPDPCFEVLDVTIDVSTISSRSLLAENDELHENDRLLSNTVQLNFNLVLSFSYSCFQCPAGSLLQNDGSRRNLQLKKTLRILKESKNKIVDRVLYGNQILPTRSEFNNEFSSRLSSIKELQGKVSGAKAIYELVEKQCDPSIHYLTQDLSIAFEGNFDYLLGGNDGSNTQVNAVEEAVKQAYNTINMPNPHYCDVDFRKIQDVSYYYASNVHPSTSSENNLFDMMFRVTYESRNEDVAELFDSIIDETDVERNEMSDGEIAKPTEFAECFCDREARFERAPTTSEFLSALKNILYIRSNEHFITDVRGGD